MACETVNEGSTAALPVRFRDVDGNLAVPISVDYRIDCPDVEDVDAQNIRPWTALTGPMADTMNIPLTPDDNVIMVPTLQKERHVVSIRVNHGTDDMANDELTYIVNNLRYFS
jgi:hypothetical protein